MARLKLPTDVSVRNLINEYGGQKYGIKDYDIGWDESAGKVTLGGRPLDIDFALESGRTYAAESDIRRAVDAYASQTGLANLTAPTVPPVLVRTTETPAWTPPPAPAGADYQDPYAAEIEALLKEILGTEAFSYDPDADPAFAAAQERYRREGSRAGTDTLGDYAAMTGGMPSSYAVTAASQERDRYAADFESNVAPALAEAAYNRYLGDQSGRLSGLQSLLSRSAQDYGRYMDALDRYNQALTFSRGVYESDREHDRLLSRDEMQDKQWRQQTLDTILSWGLPDAETAKLLEHFGLPVPF